MQEISSSQENLLFSANKREGGLHFPENFPRRRSLLAICASFAAVSLLGFLFFTFWTEQPRPQTTVAEDIPQPGHTNTSTLSIIDPFGAEANLIGAPTAQFRGMQPVEQGNCLYVYLSF
jgi:hypothetical protein